MACELSGFHRISFCPLFQQSSSRWFDRDSGNHGNRKVVLEFRRVKTTQVRASAVNSRNGKLAVVTVSIGGGGGGGGEQFLWLPNAMTFSSW